LGTDEIVRAKAFWGLPTGSVFFVSSTAVQLMGRAKTLGNEYENEWNGLLEAYSVAHPETANEFKALINKQLGTEWLGGRWLCKTKMTLRP
jgi:transketolase